MQIPDLKPAQAMRRSLLLVVQSAPKELAQLGLLNIGTGLGPAIALFLGKVVIDELSTLLKSGPVEDWRTVMNQDSILLWAIVGSLALRLLIEVASTVDILLFAALRDRVQGVVQGRVLEKLATFNDIALFERPELLNIVELTQRGVQRLQRLSIMITQTLRGLFSFVPSIALSAALAWWIPLLLISVTAPSVYVEIHHRRKSWRVEETQAAASREKEIYARLIRSEKYAKEIRLFSLQPIMIERWRSLFEQVFTAMLKVRKQGAIAMGAWSFIGAVGGSFVYVYVVIGVVQGRFTLGDIALYTGIVAQMQRSLYSLIGNIGNLYDVTLATKPIFQLFDLQPELISPPKSLAANIWQTGDARGEHHPVKQTGIEVQDLKFEYPGGERPILKGVNFRIKPGEMVALVGENGAGKTTLGKLLCRLYDPTQGSIYWNGKDYRELDLEALRDRIAVVMQDYSRFPTSLRDNVGWGFQAKRDEDDAIQRVLDEAGIGKLTREFEQGLETPLGKELENGVDLSGGQWQRVAIARALIRLNSAELLIFDEPTAALDPKNEQEIYSIFRSITRDRMAVVVSHRLALAKMADRIVVLENGEVLEEGNHDELMEKNGLYADMFTRQASSYV